MLLTGTFARSLDEKNRFAIPKPLRQVISRSGSSLAYVAPGTDGSLILYPETAFNRLAAQLDGVSPTGQDVRAFSRLFYAQAQIVEIDSQGRVRVPPELANLANLGKEIVLLGVRDHLEVWDRQRWDSYFAQKQPHYDDLAESALQATTALPRPMAAQTAAQPSPAVGENSSDKEFDGSPDSERRRVVRPR
jgi:MraZ protein